MTTLHDLYELQHQSPWLDNLRRDYLRNGHLAELVAQGIRGLTSNPTIFARAIENSSDYDEQFADLLANHSVEEAYWELVFADIGDALAILRPVYDASGGDDGFVSIEVAPALAHDTEQTARDARRFNSLLAQPNLFVKIPGTLEGLPAIRTMIGEGRSINITLLFSVERYDAVIDAYLDGLEDRAAAGADLSSVRSVASFFVSRVDTEVDRRLEQLADQADGPRAEELLGMRGTAAVAQARQAYQQFRSRFTGARWEALVAKGAAVQRPLWASTSMKNPAYPDLGYVDTLIGPDTVNTMPDETVAAFADHGTVARTVDVDPDGAARTLERLGELGVDMADVAATLEHEGVASFSKSFDELIQALADKANTLSAGR